MKLDEEVASSDDGVWKLHTEESVKLEVDVDDHDDDDDTEERFSDNVDDDDETKLLENLRFAVDW